MKTISPKQDEYLSSMIAILTAQMPSSRNTAAIDLITKVESYKGISVFDDLIMFHLHMEDWIELTNAYNYNIQDIKDTIGDAFYQLSQGAFYTNLGYNYNYKNIVFQPVPENKNLHKKHHAKQYFIDNIDCNIAPLYKSERFQKACEDLSKSLKNERYSDVITNARCLFESYGCHRLSKQEASNKTDLMDMLNAIEVVPKGIEEHDKTIKQDIQRIIESLDCAMKAVGSLRNNTRILGQAHSGGSNAVCLGEGHAYLVVGAVISCINFISKAKEKN